MRRVLFVVLMTIGAGCGASGLGRGPVVGAPEGEGQVASSVPAGTRLWVTLDETLEPAAGESFTAYVDVDLTTPDGELLVPGGAVVHGRTVAERDGALSLELEGLEVDGRMHAVEGRIEDVDLPGAPPTEEALEDEATLPRGTMLSVQLLAPLSGNRAGAASVTSSRRSL